MCNLDVISEEKHGVFTVKIVLDDVGGDINDFGTYTNSPKWGEKYKYKIINREKNGDYKRGEPRYFQCAYDMQEAQQWYTEHGYSRHDAYTLPLKTANELYERAENYSVTWGYVGIIVEYAGNTLASLWGIESDSDYTDYISDLLYEAKAELKKVRFARHGRKWNR